MSRGSRRAIASILPWLLLGSLLMTTATCKRRGGRRGSPAASTGSSSLPAAGKLSEGTLKTADGRERRYFLYEPAGAPKDPPLVLVLHGGGGNAEGTQNTSYTPAAADRLGVVLAYPEGVAKTVLGKAMATWNGDYCCGLARDEKVDDGAFLVALIDHLATKTSFDPGRVYATGISNGGIMAMRLGCEHPDRIAGISVVGSPGYASYCREPRPLAVQIIHGTADGCALYQGGQECGGCWERAAAKWTRLPVPKRSFPCASVADEAAFWLEVNGCSDATVVTYERGAARCVEHRDCKSGKPVSVCTVEGGGHTWPGAVRGCDESKPFCKAFAEITGSISSDLDANEAMTAFFLTQRAGR